MSSKLYQANLTALLREVFEPENVIPEWFIRTDATDTFAEARSYAPRLDIALGPFNPTRDTEEAVRQILDASEHPLMQRIKDDVRRQNQGELIENRNPRCLLAIELEYQTSSKHILGGFTNASMMGLVGVVISPPQKIQKISRICKYAQKLKEVGKAPAGLFSNTACYTTDDFNALVNEFINQR